MGFFFLASRGSQTVSCFCGLQSNEVLHMKAHTAGCNRLICSFLLVFCAICAFVYMSMCVVRSGKFAVCDELPQQWRQIWASRNVGFAQIVCLSALCNDEKTGHMSVRGGVQLLRMKSTTNEHIKVGRQGSGPRCIHCGCTCMFVQPGMGVGYNHSLPPWGP